MIIATGILAFSDITGKDIQGLGYSHDGNMIGSVSLFLADGTTLVLSARDHYMVVERREHEGRPDIAQNDAPWWHKHFTDGQLRKIDTTRAFSILFGKELESISSGNDYLLIAKLAELLDANTVLTHKAEHWSEGYPFHRAITRIMETLSPQERAREYEGRFDYEENDAPNL